MIRRKTPTVFGCRILLRRLANEPAPAPPAPEISGRGRGRDRQPYANHPTLGGVTEMTRHVTQKLEERIAMLRERASLASRTITDPLTGVTSQKKWWEDITTDKIVAIAAIQSGIIAVATFVIGTLYGVYDGLEEKFRVGRRFADGVLVPIQESTLRYISRPDAELEVAHLFTPRKVLALHSIVGARGVGKSELVHHVIAEHNRVAREANENANKELGVFGKLVGFLSAQWSDPMSARRAFLVPLPQKPSGVVYISLTGDPREWVVQWALSIGVNVTPSVVRQFFHKHFGTTLLTKTDIAKDPALALTTLLQKTRDMALAYTATYGQTPVLVIDNVNYSSNHPALVTHVVHWASACVENKVLQVVLVHSKGFDPTIAGMVDNGRRQKIHLEDVPEPAVRAALSAHLNSPTSADPNTIITGETKSSNSLSAEDSAALVERVVGLTGGRMLDVELTLDALGRGASLDAAKRMLFASVRHDFIAADILKPSDTFYAARDLLLALSASRELSQDRVLVTVGNLATLSRLVERGVVGVNERGVYTLGSRATEVYVAEEWRAAAAAAPPKPAYPAATAVMIASSNDARRVPWWETALSTAVGGAVAVVLAMNLLVR